MVFVLRSTEKEIGDHRIKWEGKTLLDLDYADDSSMLDESMSKINEFEVLWVQGAWINLKINIKKTKSLRLGISEEEKVMLDKEKTDQVDSFTTLVVLLMKTVGAVKVLEVEWQRFMIIEPCEWGRKGWVWSIFGWVFS